MYSFGCHVSNNLKVNSPKTTDISRVFCFCHCWCQELMDMMFDLSYSVSGEDEVQRGDFRHGRCGLCFQGPLWTAATAVDPIDWWSAFELQKDTMGYHRMHTSIAISINIIHTYIYIWQLHVMLMSRIQSFFKFSGDSFFQIFGYNLTFCCGRACSIVSCRRWSMLARVRPPRPPRRRAACWRRPAVWRRCRKTRRRIRQLQPMAPATAGEAPRRCTARRPRRWARTPTPWSATRRFRCRRCCGKYRGWRLKLLIPKRQKWWKRTKKKRKRKIVGRRHGIYKLQFEKLMFAIAEIHVKYHAEGKRYKDD